MEKFDRNWKPKAKMSIIKEYRELSMSVSLKKGRYVIVPSCKKANETGDYFLNIYFSEGEEDHSGGQDDKFKYFEATYINPTSLERPEYKEGSVIKEEDEDNKVFNDKFKQVLQIKSKYVIWNDDEDAQKAYIPADIDSNGQSK